MATLWLQLKAPFAAFRWMQAGVWRGTTAMISPSAAWGLVLNLAGIETRSAEPSVTTQVRDDAPRFELAFGSSLPTEPERSSLYQQLHSYPVGASGKELKARAHGQKYWIAPARRELLVGFEAVLGVRAEESLLRRVVDGLTGQLDAPRYGLPFAGENNFLFDTIDVLAAPPAVHWFAPQTRSTPARAGVRLTVGIDRDDASRTTSSLFAPLPEAREAPPPDAWVWVPRA